MQEIYYYDGFAKTPTKGTSRLLKSLLEIGYYVAKVCDDNSIVISTVFKEKEKRLTVHPGDYVMIDDIKDDNVKVYKSLKELAGAGEVIHSPVYVFSFEGWSKESFNEVYNRISKLGYIIYKVFDNGDVMFRNTSDKDKVLLKKGYPYMINEYAISNKIVGFEDIGTPVNVSKKNDPEEVASTTESPFHFKEDRSLKNSLVYNQSITHNIKVNFV